jgi:hypothetical protein
MSISRLCMIGNSHLACLKLAADREPGLLPAAAVDYFAGSAFSMESIRLADGHFLTTDDRRLKRQMNAVSAGKDRIDLRAYDAFVLVGLNFEYRDFFQLFRRHCLYSDLKWRGRRELVSDAYVTDYLAEMHRARPGVRLARQIRALGSAPVILAPSPFPAESIMGEKAERPRRGLRETGYFTALTDFYLRCADAAAEAAGATLAPQGSATIVSPGFTAERFNTRAVGLQSPGRSRVENWFAEKTRYDPWHMNVDFGRARLGDIAEGFEKAASSSLSRMGRARAG